MRERLAHVAGRGISGQGHARLSRGGYRLTRHGLDQIFKRLRERTGIERCYPHLLRHTFAIWSLRSGMNVYALQAIMGHSDLDTLKKYLKVVEADVENEHGKYGAVDNML